MRERIWEAEYEGHKIRVISERSFLPPKTTEILEVDGEVGLRSTSGFMQAISTLCCKHDFHGTEKIIEARLAQKSDAFKNGCQIFVNGLQVGGDYQIKYPDPHLVNEHLKGGYAKYALQTGLLKTGVPFALLMTVMFREKPVLELVLQFIFTAIFFGLAMSSISWKGMKHRAMVLSKT